MGIFIKSGILHTLKFHLHTLSCYFWLNLCLCQAIIWTNAGILLFGQLGTKFNEISIEIHIFLFKKIHFKMSSAKWGPFWPECVNDKGSCPTKICNAFASIIANDSIAFIWKLYCHWLKIFLNRFACLIEWRQKHVPVIPANCRCRLLE